MRHNKSGRQLSRNNSHRKALLRNMARALLTYEQIRTTEAKAKELRKVVEKLITLALRNDLHSRRLVFTTLGNHQLVQKLFDEIAPRFVGGGGGYTRIMKLTFPRKGDCAPLVLIELTKKAEKPAKEQKKEAAEKAKPAAPKAEPAEEAKPKAKAPKKEAEKPAEEPAAE